MTGSSRLPRRASDPAAAPQGFGAYEEGRGNRCSAPTYWWHKSAAILLRSSNELAGYRGVGTRVVVGHALISSRALAKQNGMAACRQRKPEEEEREQQNRHEQSRNSACIPFFFMRVLVWLVAHRARLMARQRSIRRSLRLSAGA